MPITECNYIPNYPSSPYGRQQSQPSYFDTNSMLVEEAETMYDKLAKDLVDEILSDYTVGTSRPSLPHISSDNPNEGAAEVPGTE